MYVVLSLKENSDDNNDNNNNDDDDLKKKKKKKKVKVCCFCLSAIEKVNSNENQVQERLNN